MPAPRVLFVKLSSLGDVVHHFPAVTDLARARPGVAIAWAVEEAYAPLVGLHPAVSTVIPVALRAAKSRPLSPTAWAGLARTRRALRTGAWDYVVDTQGLLKSALVARQARGVRFGPDRASAREAMAARTYDVKIPVPRDLHAVERNRRLVAEVFGYRIDSPARYGIVAAGGRPSWAPEEPYVALLHAASRPQKRWSEQAWVELGALLHRRGFRAVLPAGSASEREAAGRIARAIPGAMVAPAMGLAEAADLLAQAWLVVGVDTGLTHLAVALGRPTVGLYGATRPELTGLHGTNAINLGGPGAPPTVEAVADAIGPVEDGPASRA